MWAFAEKWLNLGILLQMTVDAANKANKLNPALKSFAFPNLLIPLALHVAAHLEQLWRLYLK